MLKILKAVYHDEPLMLETLSSLENPEREEERKLSIQLRAVEEKAAEAIKPSIEALADRQAEEAFYEGVRFGAQLMAELIAE